METSEEARARWNAIQAGMRQTASLDSSLTDEEWVQVQGALGPPKPQSEVSMSLKAAVDFATLLVNQEFQQMLQRFVQTEKNWRNQSNDTAQTRDSRLTLADKANGLSEGVLEPIRALLQEVRERFDSATSQERYELSRPEFQALITKLNNFGNDDARPKKENARDYLPGIDRT